MSAPNDQGTDAIEVPPPRPLKRRRTIHVCDVCRVKKNRCDGERPVCGACQRRQTECLYGGEKSYVSETQKYINRLKARNYALEQQLAAQSSNNQGFLFPPFVKEPGTSSPVTTFLSPPKARGGGNISTQHSPNNGTSQISSHYTAPAANRPDYQQLRWRSPNVPGGEQRTNGNPLIASRQLVETDSGSPRNAHDISHHTPATDHVELPSEYFGESSTFDFITKVCSPREDRPKDPISSIRCQSLGSDVTSLANSSPSAPIFDSCLLGIGNDELFSLPNRSVADRLVDAYFDFIHPLNTYLHEYKFRQRYDCLWLRKEAGGEEAAENNLAWFGLVNLVFAFGSDHANHAKLIGSIPIRNTLFFKRAKTFVFSSLFQAASIDLVQALLLMGQYLHSSLELDNSWIVVGLAIRMAQSLGLHLATSTPNIIDQEVRKRVWWGCFVIDRLLSMKVGRPPTIHDGPEVTVGLPLAIDDEYLTNDSERPPIQPIGVPSKFDFLTYVITQCRLLERICNTLYSGRQVDIHRPGLTDISKLLALAIQLDGDLAAWQQTLPTHLQFDSQVSGWHYERQRSTLLMRCLNCRLLLYRQILLIYATRQCPEVFQRQLMYPCIQSCVLAARDTIIQIQILSQRSLLHPWWHNTHSLFTALCVMLAFKMLGPQKKAEVGLLDSVDVDEVISRGTQLLQEVGDHCHPLAAQYFHWFQKLERKLPTLSLGQHSILNDNPSSLAAPSAENQVRLRDLQSAYLGDTNDVFVVDERHIGDDLRISDEQLFEIENMFFSTSWSNPAED